MVESLVYPAQGIPSLVLHPLMGRILIRVSVLAVATRFYGLPYRDCSVDMFAFCAQTLSAFFTVASYYKSLPGARPDRIERC